MVATAAATATYPLACITGNAFLERRQHRNIFWSLETQTYALVLPNMSDLCDIFTNIRSKLDVHSFSNSCLLAFVVACVG
jgi:hypothetical protein